MILAVAAIRVLEAMFFLGMIGSAVVVLISFVEDGKELFGKDKFALQWAFDADSRPANHSPSHPTCNAPHPGRSK